METKAADAILVYEVGIKLNNKLRESEFVLRS